VHVNSTSPSAAHDSGAASITADRLDVVGGASLVAGSLNGSLHTGEQVMPDPYASLPVPPMGGDHGGIDSSGTFWPGYYSGGIRLSNGSQNVTLQPGVYVLGGNGLVISGSAFLHATGVTLYVAAGRVDISGGADVDLTPTTSGPYAGVTLFQARGL